MEAVETVRGKQGETDYSEAEHVDSQYVHLLKNKDKGITEEELCRKRAAKRLISLFSIRQPELTIAPYQCEVGAAREASLAGPSRSSSDRWPRPWVPSR
jgi:hypothetical protein